MWDSLLSEEAIHLQNAAESRDTTENPTVRQSPTSMSAAVRSPRPLHRSSEPRSLRARAFSLSAIVGVACALIAASISGCEAVVSGVLPAYSCPGISAELACPANEVCFQPLGQCVAATAVCDLLRCPEGSHCDANSATCIGTMPDAGVDASTFDSALSDTSIAPPTETGPIDTGTTADTSIDTSVPPTDAQTACRGLGCRCAGIDDCDSRVCGDALTLGADVVAATSSNVCTKPCCSSLDCAPTTVCFGAGTGGNYCIKPSVLGRQVPITRNAAGASCTLDTDCASARCNAGTCADTCCSAAAGVCPTGSQCALTAFPGLVAFDKHYTFVCSPSNARGADGDNCQRASDCRSAVCASTCTLCNESCHAPCHNTADCPAGEVCGDVKLTAQTSTNDVGLLCASASGQTGSKAIGVACTNDFDCKTGSCDTKLAACTDVCLADSDCAGAPAGWRCRPTTVAILGQGSYSVSRCGP